MLTRLQLRRLPAGSVRKAWTVDDCFRGRDFDFDKPSCPIASPASVPSAVSTTTRGGC